ncbi:MAG: family 78 glycoside hydrolase catalytic domain [Microbacteriaceae bacterium]|nr:family 78 glycoside hydrolase catalytic domain [Microbacteriaceae bacterium]
MSAAPTRLTVESLERPLGMWTARPRFGWQRPSGEIDAQRAYELEVHGDSGVVVGSGRVESAESSLVELPGFEAASRTAYRWRVRVWTDGARPSEWSDSAFETTILDPRDWRASWVEPVQPPVTREQEVSVRRPITPDQRPKLAPPEERLHPAPLLRQPFRLDEVPKRARLYLTSHGLVEVRINGALWSDELFVPGYDAHPYRLSYFCYDVTELLQQGENVLALTLADGWWAGRTSAAGLSANHGDRLQAFWQLEGDGEVLAVSGRPAKSSTGAIRYSDIFIGEKVDARHEQPGWDAIGFDDSGWDSAYVAGGSVAGLVPFIGEPVRRVTEIIDPVVLRTPRGEIVVDLGQNIAGRLRVSGQGPAGTTVRLEHTEQLDRDGNFQVSMLGFNKDQVDVWTLAGNGRETFEPTFTFHGFRYVRVTGYPGDLRSEDVVGVVISSDLEQTGFFRTDDARINRLHENVVWSQRANFLSIPTDCPQRERAGWTGDIQIFAPAATNNMQVLRFVERWLANLRSEQFADGQVPMLVPNTPSFQRMYTDRFQDDSSAGWGDAVTIVPLVLYERYGDRRVLEENYDAMQRWVAYCRRAAREGVPERYRGAGVDPAVLERQRVLWNTGFHYGDWLAPSTVDPADFVGTMTVAQERTAEIIAAMFFARSVENLAIVASILGDADLETEMRALREDIGTAFAQEYVLDDGRLTADMQGCYLIALAFDLVPPERREGSARRLVELVHEHGDHLDAGFLSIPYLLDVLTDIGRADLAYRLLLQDTPPSWLYQVRMGATTIWESWFAVSPEGDPGLLSYNHYAFGCVDDWLFRQVAGIRPLEPGYRSLEIRPDLAAPFGEVEASVQTPYGAVAVQWSSAGAEPVVVTEVPAGVRAELVLPGRAPVPLRAGRSEHRG